MACWDISGEKCEPMETRCELGQLPAEGSSCLRLEFGRRQEPLSSCWFESERSILPLLGWLETGLASRCAAKLETGGWRQMGSLERLSTLRKVVICSCTPGSLCAEKRGEQWQGICEEDCELKQLGGGWAAKYRWSIRSRSVSYLAGLSSMLWRRVGMPAGAVALAKALSSAMACSKPMRSAVRQRKLRREGLCGGIERLSMLSSRHSTTLRTMSSCETAPPLTVTCAHFGPAHTFTTPRSLMPMQSLSTGKHPTTLASQQKPQSACSQRCSTSGKGILRRSHSRMGIFSRKREASYFEVQNSVSSASSSWKQRAATHRGLCLRMKESSRTLSNSGSEMVRMRWRSMWMLWSVVFSYWTTSLKGEETSRQLDSLNCSAEEWWLPIASTTTFFKLL